MASGIEKRMPGLGLHIEGFAKQLLNGLSLLAHVPSVRWQYGRTALPAIAKQKS
jgi:hypothetical protein